MADRFPLILNTSTNQIQEIPSGDNLDLTGTGINNAGIITAGNVTIGAATTDLVVNGDARVTGILTVGTSSLKLDGPNNLVNVGTALTLGHSQGLQFHTQNLHSAGFEVNQINASGIITATEADINGDLDVDGHTNLDNLSVAGVSTFAGAVTTGDHVTLSGQNPRITFTDSNHNPDYEVYGSAGNFKIWDSTSNTSRLTINTDGHVDIPGNLDCESGIDVTGNVIASGNVSAVEGTFTGNVSIGGTLTYEDVTNIDSVGIVTAREGIFIPDTKELKIGQTAGTPDLKIYSDGTNGYIREQGPGSLYIQGVNLILENTSGTNYFAGVSGAEAIIYHNGNPKLQTSNTGVTVTGNIAVSGTVDGVDIAAFKTSFDSLNTDLINDTSPQLGGDLDVNSKKIKGGHTIYEIVTNTRHKFDCNGSTIMNINAGGVDFSAGHNTHSDNVENRHGTHNDIRIYHSGSHSYIKNTTDYTLWIQNNDSQSVIVSNNSGVNKSASFNIGAAAELYHANTKRFETESGGAKVSGQLTVDGQIIAYSANNNTLGLTGHRWANIFSQQGNFNNTVTIGASASSDALIIQNSSNLKFCDGNGATTGTVSFDARTYDTNKARLHKWTSPNLGGGSYGNYSEAWFDGGAYRHITCKSSGFEFDHHLFPSADNSKDLGTSSNRWRNVYTNDLNLSNEGGKNNVDGTWGNYTIQEGESDLFLINNRSGKKYKFNLTEVS